MFGFLMPVMERFQFMIPKPKKQITIVRIPGQKKYIRK
jgi:hypothetical protein